MPQKADLVSGLVSPSQLGTGAPTSSTCLSGINTWIACGGGGGGGGNATELQGFPISATAPTVGQGLFYLGGLWTPSTSTISSNTSIFNNQRIVPPPTITPTAGNYNWQQNGVGSLTGGTPTTQTVTPCPLGIDTTNTTNWGSYGVYISGGTGTAEATAVTGGTCTGGAASGTIIFTPVWDSGGQPAHGTSSSPPRFSGLGGSWKRSTVCFRVQRRREIRWVSRFVTRATSFRVRYCSSHHATLPKGPPSICAEVSRETAVKKGAD